MAQLVEMTQANPDTSSPAQGERKQARPPGGAVEQTPDGSRKALLLRILGELRPVRRWIVLSNLLIVLSSVIGVFSLVAVVPILQVVFDPPEVTAVASAAVPAAAAPALAPSSDQIWSLDAWKASARVWFNYRLQYEPVETVYWICFLFALAAIFTALLNFASEACIVRVQTTFQRQLMRRLYLHCLTHDLGFFQRRGTGALLNHIYNDVTKMSEAVKLTYGVRVRDPIVLLCLTVLLLATHPGLTVLLLATVPLVILPAIFLGRRIKEVSRKETGMDGGLMELLQERLSGIRLIKGFGAEARELGEFDRVSGDVFDRRRRRGLLTAMSNPAMETMSTLGVAIILLFGVHAVLKTHWIDGKTYFFFLVVLSRFYKPLKELAGLNVGMQRPLMSAEVVYRLLDTPHQVVDSPDAVDFPEDWKTFKFSSVSFRYGGRRKPYVLDNVSFTIRAGRSTAIIGHNGSGKSTVAALMARFYDVKKGRIKVDGVDLRSIRLASVRRAIGVCSQESVLFNLTVAENIAFGVPPEQIDRNRLEWAARQAGADRFISKLPQGFDAPVGARGGRLSGGQRQVLALARMFYHDFRIVVFDEPSTHLDIQTEQCILEGMRRLAAERTVILITHDLRHLDHFQHVVVLEKGRVIRDVRTEEIDTKTLLAS